MLLRRGRERWPIRLDAAGRLVQDALIVLPKALDLAFQENPLRPVAIDGCEVALGDAPVGTRVPPVMPVQRSVRLLAHRRLMQGRSKGSSDEWATGCARPHGLMRLPR